MRGKLISATALAALAALAVTAGIGCGSTSPSTSPESSRTLVAMTQNVYIGVDVGAVLAASETADDLAAVVDGALADAQASDYPARAAALARTVAEHRPHVIGLQEVALWRTQSPADGDRTPATTVELDFLALVEAALGAEGLDYATVAVHEGVDLELEGARQDVRFTDRDALLLRGDLEATRTLTGRFEASLAVPYPLGGELTVPRGWAAAEFELAGEPVRAVTSHLEVPPWAGIQERQAQELVDGPLEPPDGHIVVLLADINAEPDDLTSGVHAIVLSAGLVDAWAASGDAAGGGATCCREADLQPRAGDLSARIDIVAASASVRVRVATRVGDEPRELTAAGRAYADHAGVVATLELG